MGGGEGGLRPSMLVQRVSGAGIEIFDCSFFVVPRVDDHGDPGGL